MREEEKEIDRTSDKYLRNFIESIIFSTYDTENLDVEPSVIEKGLTIEEAVKLKLPALKRILSQALSSQREELLEKILEKLRGRLEYCQEQNGLPYCKNCGLCEKDLSEVKKILTNKNTSI